MFQTELHYMVRREQQKEWVRQAQRPRVNYEDEMLARHVLVVMGAVITLASVLYLGVWNALQPLLAALTIHIV